MMLLASSGGQEYTQDKKNDYYTFCFFQRHGRMKKQNHLRYISRTKRFSRGATAFVFSARHVNTEYRSDRCSEGHRRRFSMMLPEFCSYSSSTKFPFMNQDTSGWGRPK